MIPMTTDHTFTLGQAAPTGRSKSTISKALKTGTLSYRDRTESGLDAAFDRALHRLYKRNRHGQRHRRQ